MRSYLQLPIATRVTQLAFWARWPDLLLRPMASLRSCLQVSLKLSTKYEHVCMQYCAHKVHPHPQAHGKDMLQRRWSCCY